jgi:hypothetical protein
VPSNLERFKNDLERLVSTGTKLMQAWAALHKKRESPPNLSRDYQRWYSEAHEVLRQLLPMRQEEFEALYRSDPRRKSLSVSTYTIQDWLLGLRSGTNSLSNERFFDDYGAALMRFNSRSRSCRRVRDALRARSSRSNSSLPPISSILDDPCRL